MSLSFTCSCFGGWECLSASDRSNPHFSRKNMLVPAISFMRPTPHWVERNQTNEQKQSVWQEDILGAFIPLCFSGLFLFLCMHLCWYLTHVYTHRDQKSAFGSFLQTMVLKANCLLTWVLGPGKGFVIYLGKTLPFHGLEALMSFVMAVLMSIIVRAPWLPTSNKNSGCNSRSSNPNSSSCNSRRRAASGVIVAAAVIIMVPSQ